MDVHATIAAASIRKARHGSWARFWPEHFSVERRAAGSDRRLAGHVPARIGRTHRLQANTSELPVLVTAELTQLLRDVLTSRVYDVARETPLDMAPRLSERLDNEVLLKREDLQPVFSFKLRGAYNKIAHLSDKERARGIIAASAGNHAQGVAFSAQKLGLRAIIVMPQTTPRIKVDAVRSMGAEVVLAGDSYDDAKAHCDTLVSETGMTFIHPFDDPLVIAGAGDDRRRDPAPQPGSVVGRVRAGGRRRPDRRHRRLHQGAAART